MGTCYSLVSLERQQAMDIGKAPWLRFADDPDAMKFLEENVHHGVMIVSDHHEDAMFEQGRVRYLWDEHEKRWEDGAEEYPEDYGCNPLNRDDEIEHLKARVAELEGILAKMMPKTMIFGAGPLVTASEWEGRGRD